MDAEDALRFIEPQVRRPDSVWKEEVLVAGTFTKRDSEQAKDPRLRIIDARHDRVIPRARTMLNRAEQMLESRVSLGARDLLERT